MSQPQPNQNKRSAWDKHDQWTPFTEYTGETMDAYEGFMKEFEKKVAERVAIFEAVLKEIEKKLPDGIEKIDAKNSDVEKISEEIFGPANFGPANFGSANFDAEHTAAPHVAQQPPQRSQGPIRSVLRR